MILPSGAGQHFVLTTMLIEEDYPKIRLLSVTVINNETVPSIAENQGLIITAQTLDVLAVLRMEPSVQIVGLQIYRVYRVPRD